MSQKKREWVRSFEITTVVPQKGKSILFQVTSLLFPVGFPEAATKLTVKKRYTDFQALHKSLAEIHRNLYLRGKFPDLPKSSKGYFKRSESPNSCEDKRLKCLGLLDFCAEHPQLCNNRIFTNFFSDVESPKSEAESPKSETDQLLIRDEPDRAVAAVERSISPNAETTSTILRLSKDGQYLQAATLSLDLAPDPTPSLLPPPCMNQEKPTKGDSQIVPALNESGDDIPEYLSDAANFISMAIQYESEENYDESVACYRSAIGTLLKSVQKDTCLQRQASVKRRIAQYINKAEKLIELQDNGEKFEEKASPKKSINRIPHLELFGNIRDLRKFKIESILANKVLLVSETQSDNNQVVIKALQKSSLVFKTRKTSMLPVNINFMVKLLRYFETDDLIYLVLEYIPYGQIFTIVKPYLERQISKELSQTNVGGDESTFSNISLIKPSPSFVQIRRKSIQPDQDNLRRTASSENLSSKEKDNLEYLRTYSLENGETSSVEDFNYVYVREDDESNLFCLNKDGIEKIDCTVSNSSIDDKNSDEERISVGPDLNGIKKVVPIGEVVSISVSIDNERKSSDSADIDELVRDSENLLSSLATQLALSKENKTAEAILLEVGQIERHVHLHLDGRSLTPSPIRSFRAPSGSPVSPPSTSSVASSPPPRYADDRSPSSDLVLSDLISSFDGIDLCSPDAILPMSLLRRWSIQLCQVLFALHSRGVIIQDLHPANLMLGRDLNLRLTYQCEWVSVDKAVNWNAIENLYSAPEVSDVGPLTPACDWWSVGAILYELLTGHRLVDIHPSGLLSHTPLHFPDSAREGKEKTIEMEMRELVTAFLQPVPLFRLGAGTSGNEDIRIHPFFKNVNWNSCQ